MLELAILGLLHDSPMHGYELRKRLLNLLGAFRAAISYGSLYPTLKRMRERGLIVADEPDATDEAPVLTGRRARIIYRLSPEGKERFAEIMSGSGGDDCFEDAHFGVHFAFFSRTDPATRLRILEGRRRRVEERRERIRAALDRTTERLDAYGVELQRHGLETADREVRWLNELIASEEQGTPPSQTSDTDRHRSGASPSEDAEKRDSTIENNEQGGMRDG
ncbi:PadR family transcriptional regulator [Natronoglycomyces albus]|uniref:Helix-turn-helix transcriptional regulator n=1 Tax=Natronoglycomyces albus TaxID=2811108 RepID=A0A895XQD9_9ACTN|nr:PadR family transcriptional regulator [Natronoglycomyces albus]QSB05355.1 helix-turn-helix transcriptional regulator [Natronoglycomyces albus]